MTGKNDRPWSFNEIENDPQGAMDRLEKVHGSKTPKFSDDELLKPWHIKQKKGKWFVVGKGMALPCEHKNAARELLAQMQEAEQEEEDTAPKTLEEIVSKNLLN